MVFHSFYFPLCSLHLKKEKLCSLTFFSCIFFPEFCQHLFYPPSSALHSCIFILWSSFMEIIVSFFFFNIMVKFVIISSSTLWQYFSECIFKLLLSFDAFKKFFKKYCGNYAMHDWLGLIFLDHLFIGWFVRGGEQDKMKF